MVVVVVNGKLARTWKCSWPKWGIIPAFIGGTEKNTKTLLRLAGARSRFKPGTSNTSLELYHYIKLLDNIYWNGESTDCADMKPTLPGKRLFLYNQSEPLGAHICSWNCSRSGCNYTESIARSVRTETSQTDRKWKRYVTSNVIRDVRTQSRCDCIVVPMSRMGRGEWIPLLSHSIPQSLGGGEARDNNWLLFCWGHVNTGEQEGGRGQK